MQLRWLMASDSSITAPGSRIDDIQVTNGYTCGPVGPVTPRSRADFDGDGKLDLAATNEVSDSMSVLFNACLDLAENLYEAVPEEDFVRILTEPENALLKQYRALLSAESVDLTFSDDAVREIARDA